VHCAGETEYSTLLQNSFAASAPYSVQPICTLCVNCSASRTRTHIFIAHPHTFYIEHILYRTCSTFSLHTLTYTVSFRGQFAGAHMYTHTHTNTCSHTHAHTHIHTHTHTHTHTHSLTHSLTHTYTHIHTHIHTHTHTHTHTAAMEEWHAYVRDDAPTYAYISAGQILGTPPSINAPQQHQQHQTSTARQTPLQVGLCKCVCVST
jgi:hypothetical protein